MFKLKKQQILGYFGMFIFSFYVNLVSAGLQEQHLKTHIKWPRILQSSRLVFEMDAPGNGQWCVTLKIPNEHVNERSWLHLHDIS